LNVDTMRAVDHYAGVPLCFLGTQLARLLERVSPRRARSPKNVLLLELSEMGSAILADPAMQKLKRELGANLFFAIFERNRPSLELLGTVPARNVFPIRDTGLLSLATDALRLLAWTRRRRIDTVIDLELFSRFTALLTGFAGASHRVGFHSFHNEGLYRGDFLTRRVAYNPHVHIAKNFVALVNALLSSRPETPYSKTVVGDEEVALGKARVDGGALASMKAKITRAYPGYREDEHRLVLVNANASELLPLRRWAPENYATVAREILQRCPKALLLLTGASSERDSLQRIAVAVGSERCVNLAGQTSFAELPALYSLSAFLLSNDSGPPHFASVTDLPIFVLFGPETPALYGPLGNATPIYAGLACSPCVSAANHRKTACNDNVCMQVITPEQVLAVLGPSLARLA
jgi:ADP-heptose:LPS heptosyltransferase